MWCLQTICVLIFIWMKKHKNVICLLCLEYDVKNHCSVDSQCAQEDTAIVGKIKLWHDDAHDDAHCDLIMQVVKCLYICWDPNLIRNSAISITQSKNIKLILKSQNTFIPYKMLLNNIFLLNIWKIMVTLHRITQNPSQRKKSQQR